MELAQQMRWFGNDSNRGVTDDNKYKNLFEELEK